MDYILKCLYVFAATGIFLCTAEYQEATVYLQKGGKFKVTYGVLDKEKGVAYAAYNNSLMQTGWGTLDIKAGYGTDGLTDKDYMYAAGLLEGALTAKQIWQSYVNMISFMRRWHPTTGPLTEKIKAFLEKQDLWTREQLKTKGDSDPFWVHVGYVMAQLDGLADGYIGVAQKQKGWLSDKFVVTFLNAQGDLIDIIPVLDPSTLPDYSKMSQYEVQQHVLLHGHCSALVKVTGALENLFMAHSTWFDYSTTNRIYKFYDFNIQNKETASKQISFSSYPGCIESTDDFYLLSSNMVMLQTTNQIFNHSLYELIKPQSLLAWQRVRVANAMANSGRDWATYLAKENSGTYNNQYMIIDLKRIELNKAIHDDALWVVEQIPGLVVAGDQSTILRAGYWPSYNVPFYEEIYNKSGYPEFVHTHGLNFSYQLAPRANIFRRDQDKVVDIDSMKKIMRYNDYIHDKYSDGNPCNTICCRGDLGAKGKPQGCDDTKVTDYNMALQFKAYAINGPTLGSGLKPFSWTGQYANISHVGLPTMYDFDWVTMKPKL